MYDIIVIGGGPAGISASVYGVSRGKKVLLLEQAAIGGLVGKVSTVTHYSGIVAGETGKTFAERLKAQAEGAGVEIRYETVTAVSLKVDVKKVTTDSSEYESKTVIIANGTVTRKLGIPGEHLACANAARDAASCRGKHIYVVGGADGAVKEALFLAGYASTLTIIHFEEQLGCISEFREKIASRDNMDVMLGTRLNAIIGGDSIEALELKDEKTGELRRIEAADAAVFIYAGSVPNTSLYTELGLKDGFIPVNESMETGIPGVYAAGDIRVKAVRQVATAVSDGAIAGIKAAAY